jgi:hypothetical protein
VVWAEWPTVFLIYLAVLPLSKAEKDSDMRWKFTDDLGRKWNGLGAVEHAPDEADKFVVTLKLARAA